MVDLIKDHHGRMRTRLLDLVPGLSGRTYGDWPIARGPQLHQGIQVATLNPFRNSRNTIDGNLQDATGVLDHFHVIQLANKAVDEVRRRVQQDTLGRRGRKSDPVI